jgi:hypothetical protein
MLSTVARGVTFVTFYIVTSVTVLVAIDAAARLR